MIVSLSVSVSDLVFTYLQNSFSYGNIKLYFVIYEVPLFYIEYDTYLLSYISLVIFSLFLKSIILLNPGYFYFSKSILVFNKILWTIQSSGLFSSNERIKLIVIV